MPKGEYELGVLLGAIETSGRLPEVTGDPCVKAELLITRDAWSCTRISVGQK
jgi:hypothetical protein